MTTDRLKTKRTWCAVSDSSYHSHAKHAPDWAKAIAREECSAKTLTLVWNKQGASKAWHGGKSYRANYVSGVAHAWGKRVSVWGDVCRITGPVITINAGAATSALYQLSVLLHEIAHINVGAGHDHDKVWQKEVVRLYRKYDLLQKVLDGEWYGYECERKAVETALNRSRSKQVA